MSEAQIVLRDRRAAVLTPSQLPCLARVPTVNLTVGCAHGCLYCYSRSYSQYPGDGKLVLYANTLQKMQDELRRKRVKPAFVYFSPSTDVFQPVAAALNLAHEIFAFLLSQGIGVAFVSKGVIPSEHMALFEAHPQLIRAQIGLITLNPGIIQVFEPGAAPVEVRLRQIEALIRMGTETEIRLDPILPGLTDDTETLNDLFRTLSGLGVKRVALNVLYLRPVLFQVLRERIPDKRMRERLIDRYVPGERVRVCNEKFSQVALPKAERADIFERATRLARAHALACHRCGCMNPDIVAGNCNLTGEWSPQMQEPRQMPLL